MSQTEPVACHFFTSFQWKLVRLDIYDETFEYTFCKFFPCVSFDNEHTLFFVNFISIEMNTADRTSEKDWTINMNYCTRNTVCDT
jgi:hypothetical protein